MRKIERHSRFCGEGCLPARGEFLLAWGMSFSGHMPSAGWPLPPRKHAAGMFSAMAAPQSERTQTRGGGRL